MKAKNVIIAGSLILLALLAIFHFRVQVWTLGWHWRHGDTINAGNYQFPVPRNWLPISDTADSVLMVEVRREREKNSWPPSTIMLLPHQRPIDPELWESVQKQVAKRRESAMVDSRSFAFDGETLKCLNLGDILHIPGIPGDSIDCLSTGGLEVMFSGSQRDSEEFYALLPQMHRKSVR